MFRILCFLKWTIILSYLCIIHQNYLLLLFFLYEYRRIEWLKAYIYKGIGMTMQCCASYCLNLGWIRSCYLSYYPFPFYIFCIFLINGKKRRKDGNIVVIQGWQRWQVLIDRTEKLIFDILIFFVFLCKFWNSPAINGENRIDH